MIVKGLNGNALNVIVIIAMTHRSSTIRSTCTPRSSSPYSQCIIMVSETTSGPHLCEPEMILLTKTKEMKKLLI